MAYTSVEMEAPAGVVFSTIIDAHSYPRWLVGAQDIRSVDPTWPAPGSSFHHRVGVGPLTVPDRTTVLELETDRRLVLKVRARPLLTALVTFSLVGNDDRCVLSVKEEPTHPALGTLLRPIIDPATHVRNHRSLLNLRALISQRQGQRSPDHRLARAP